MSDHQLISAGQLAKALGVHRSTIHRRVQRGQLIPTTWLGYAPLFSADDVPRLVRGERHLPTDEGRP